MRGTRGGWGVATSSVVCVCALCSAVAVEWSVLARQLSQPQTRRLTCPHELPSECYNSRKSLHPPPLVRTIVRYLYPPPHPPLLRLWLLCPCWGVMRDANQREYWVFFYYCATLSPKGSNRVGWWSMKIVGCCCFLENINIKQRNMDGRF